VWTQRGETPAHHLDEKMQCQGTEKISRPPGSIQMTRRN
jgi:hypothetical protein